MNGRELKGWKKNCKKEVIAQIVLNRMKKEGLIKKKKEKEIQKKINLLGYGNFLKSPHLEGKEELKKKAVLMCLDSYRSLIGFTK